jgi:hypothetical protein
MTYREEVISESFTVKTKTHKNGNISLNDEIGDWIRIRWNNQTPTYVGFIIIDDNRSVLFNGKRLVSKSNTIEATQAIQKYLNSYEPIEIRVIHFRDGREPDVVFNVYKQEVE